MEEKKSIQKSFLKNFFKESLRFLKNQYVLIISILSSISLVLIWILWLLKMVSFGQIYSPLFTSKFLGSLSNYSLPIFVTIVFFLNLYLAQKSFFKERLASFFLLGSTFFVEILTLILIRFYLIQGF